jgi:hypothetical protein
MALLVEHLMQVERVPVGTALTTVAVAEVRHQVMARMEVPMADLAVAEVLVTPEVAVEVITVQVLLPVTPMVEAADIKLIFHMDPQQLQRVVLAEVEQDLPLIIQQAAEVEVVTPAAAEEMAMTQMQLMQVPVEVEAVHSFPAQINHLQLQILELDM